MTKISTYNLDEKITALDKWIGSDVNQQNRTKNFTPKKLAEYFNEDQIINIGIPLQYKYYTLDPGEQRPRGTLSFETEVGQNVNFSSITTFLLSKYTEKQNIVSDFLNFLNGSKVLLFKSSDINSFGFYEITSIEPYETDPNFFVVTVQYETGNGFMQEDNDYMLSLVSLPQSAIPTKTSDLINDGQDGVHPFISEEDINRTEWDAAYDGKINSAEVTGTSTKTLTLTKQDGSTIEASWTDDNTDAVTSVFGRTGDVTAQSDDYNTGQITEVTNKKYQTDNQALFNDATSSIQTQLDSKQPSLGYTPVPNTRTITINGTSYDLSANRSWTIDTNSAVWGNISGTLSNQTDLQSALSAKVPYSGATGNIDLGEYGLTSGYYKFDLTPTGTPTSLGTMYWDSFYRTISLIDGDGDTTLQIGQEERVLIHNNTGSTLTDGQVVYVTGSTGELPSVSLASNTSEATSSVTFGVVTETILNGADGFITTSGIIHGLNTLSYDEGSAIWLGSTPGTFTQTKPVAPLNSVLVGYIIKKSGGNGSIFVKIQNGYELEELHDVLISNVSGNEILAYEGSPTNLWKNKSVIDVLGFTPYNSTNPSNYISLTALSSTATGLSYNNTNGVFSLTSGYVIPTTTEESNWNTAYSNRITSASLPLSISSNSISISQATSTTNGYLTSSDWNTFNNKQSAGNYITALTGEATASGPGNASIILSNSAVTSKILTGVNITGGTILDTDSILTAFGKVQNQINGLIGGSIYQGTWNASTNTPSLSSSVGTKGYYYIVNIAGSTNLNGITDWNVGDWAIYDGTSWQKVDNTDAVVSVNGFTGAVSLTTSNISEGVNLYYTESRVSSNADVAANTAARHNAVTIGTANGLSLSTQVLSLGLASSSTNGALSSTDWNTFNNKQSALTNPVTGTGGNTEVAFFNSTGSTITSHPNIKIVGGQLQTASLKVSTLGAGMVYSDSVGNVGTLTGTTDTLTYWSSAGIIGSLSTTTYPSLTELSYVKGVTSSIQTQLNGKQNALTNPITGTGTTNYLPKFTGSTSLGNSLIYDNGTNVLIGATTAPSGGIAKLVLYGGAGGGIQMISALNNGGGALAPINGGGTLFYNYTGALGTESYSEVMRITSSGNVGIGITSPSYILQTKAGSGFVGAAFSSSYAATSIIGNDANSSWFGQGTNGLGSAYVINNTSGYAQIELGGSPRFYVNSSGNVGIGTTSPSTKLEVVGNLKSSLSGYELQMYPAWDTGVAGFGTSSNHGLVLATNSAERMRITSSGNVGIGTTAPNGKLDVVGGEIRCGNGTIIGGLSYSSRVEIGAFSNHSLGLITNYTTRMLIDTSGNVGIGVTSPTDGKLQVAGNSQLGNTIAQTYFGVGAAATKVTSNGSWAIGVDAADGSTERMRITSSGNVGIGTTSPSYKLDVNGEARINNVLWFTPTSGYTAIGASGTDFNIYNGSGAQTRFTINASGNVGIGTTSPNQKLSVNSGTSSAGNLATAFGDATNTLLYMPYSGPGYYNNAAVNGGSGLFNNVGSDFFVGTHNGGAVRFGSGGEVYLLASTGSGLIINTSNNATFAGTVTATGFFNSSDIRLKTIVDYKYSVADIKPITYLWKDGRDDKRHVGYSAQEVQKVMPDAVNEGSDGMLSVNYVEVLVAKIAELENRIKLLENGLE